MLYSLLAFIFGILILALLFPNKDDSENNALLYETHPVIWQKGGNGYPYQIDRESRPDRIDSYIYLRNPKMEYDSDSHQDEPKGDIWKAKLPGGKDSSDDWTKEDLENLDVIVCIFSEYDSA